VRGLTLVTLDMGFVLQDRVGVQVRIRRCVLTHDATTLMSGLLWPPTGS